MNDDISPTFAYIRDKYDILPSYVSLDNPWAYAETDKYIHLIRPYFHMLSWEYGKPIGHKGPLSEKIGNITNCFPLLLREVQPVIYCQEMD